MIGINFKHSKHYAICQYTFTVLKHENYQLWLVITSGLEGRGEKNRVPISLPVSLTFYLSINLPKYGKILKFVKSGWEINGCVFFPCI